jgi:hypothetical protein
MMDRLAPYRSHPYFDRAESEIDEIIPPFTIPIDRDAVRTLMILAWLRGAAWQSHDTN